ncbi:M23 family metallopeptidase [Sphingomonas sp. CGMCC 1.13658]|nr:M23 family metallopeptidase [Sphingomonas sp. CGMCC 1.13658]
MFSTEANAVRANKFRRVFNMKVIVRSAFAIAVASTSVAASADSGDAQYKALFQSWKSMDQVGQNVPADQGSMSVPSLKPVANLNFSSFYGVRSDPFRGTAAMHAGVDIPGPTGTPIYATADGIVERAGWTGGYGNLVELEHGRGLETRYGHLSKIMVQPGQRVKRGEVIALMGSTGRSTGSHLHYEVRMDGRAVNPVPYLDSAELAVAMKQRVNAMTAPLAQGGPDGEALGTN